MHGFRLQFPFNCVTFVLCLARRDVKIEKGEDANVLDAAAKVNKQFQTCTGS
jgi:hypothetical protein